MAEDDDMAGETESGWCDVYDGGWVRDEEARPLYAPGTCPYVDEAYSCAANGRPDDGYTRWRWAPRHCSLPRYRPHINVALTVAFADWRARSVGSTRRTS